jgi:hypothetical protein
VVLFKKGSEPQSGDAQFVEITLFKLPDNPFDIPSFKSPEHSRFILALKIEVIGSIAVVKPVRQQEIYVRIFPEKRDMILRGIRRSSGRARDDLPQH